MGAFLVGELERLDMEEHPPLVDVTWSRDVPTREDITIADETSSFTNMTFAHPGGINPNGKNFVGKETNAVSGPQLDISKTVSPLYNWASELNYTIYELESAIKLGRPIDVEKYQAIQLKHQMDIDEQAYIGDTTLGYTGLLNSDSIVTHTNAPNGSWATNAFSTPSLVLADVNAILNAAWAASGYAITPSELRVPPNQFGVLNAAIVSSAGGISLLKFIEQNSLCMARNGRPLNVQPIKWLTAANRGVGSDRMIAYTRDKMRVRLPISSALQRTPLQYRSLWQSTTYYGKLGVVEFPYPETLYYMDGI